MKCFSKILLVFFLLVVSITMNAQQVKEPNNNNPEWSKNYAPFKIAGNLYYVGTYDLACYLIATNKGLILINTGLASSAAQIKNNIKTLGFKYSDIKILLTTQAHYDHLGAMATIKKETGATMMIDEKDAEALSAGGVTDYEMGKYGVTFAPVKADKLLKDGDTITLGDTHLTMFHHPGHTKGSCSYIFTVHDQQKDYRVLIANLPSIITDNHFDKIAAYPNIEQDYAYTLQAMKSLKFDLWVASHASQFELHKKHQPGDAYNPEAFRDQKGYDEQLAGLQEAFDEKVKSDKQ